MECVFCVPGLSRILKEKHSMAFLFITGIDTDIGKTYITGLIARAYKEKGCNVITAKIAQTGCTGVSEDVLLHRRIMATPLFPEDEKGITCPYVFPLPASPHLAAESAGHVIDVLHIRSCLYTLSEKYELVIVEGVGGIHVPLNRSTTVMDFLAEEKWPAIIVTSPRLGSINHTILSYEALTTQNIPVQALIYNCIEETDTRITKDSLTYFRERWPDTPVIEVPIFAPDSPPNDVIITL